MGGLFSGIENLASLSGIGNLPISSANHAEATEELDKIQPELRGHPEVLKVRWEVCIRAHHWGMAQEISDALTRMLPDDPGIWLMHANSFHFAGENNAAYEIAAAKLRQFPKEWTIPYNLACHCCHLGKLEEAKTWLHRAMERGDRRKIQELALTDPDLEPLRKLQGLG